jgi:hypothetical protein
MFKGEKLLESYHGLFHRTFHFVESFDFETPRRVQERREQVLRHIDLSGVRKLEHGRGLIPSCVFQDDDGMLARRLLQKNNKLFTSYLT